MVMFSSIVYWTGEVYNRRTDVIAISLDAQFDFKLNALFGILSISTKAVYSGLVYFKLKVSQKESCDTCLAVSRVNAIQNQMCFSCLMSKF